MARLFDAYIMVDWSSAAKPATGPNSVWIGVMKRDARFRPTFEAYNPATRREAEKQIRDVLADLRRRSERALIGFDFALGYPRGTAARLGVSPPDWSGVWTFLSKAVVDKADNTNNRAGVAGRMNRLISEGPRPFWGAPRAADASTTLSKTKPADHLAGLPEFRHAEAATRGLGKAGAKTVWQISGAGTVGGQTLVGIPAAKRLRDELGERAKVWPFETGWKALTREDVDGLAAVIVEIYPALAPAPADAGEVADRAQVRAQCEMFARLDDRGQLGKAFGPKAGVDEGTKAEVETEEGWILGA